MNHTQHRGNTSQAGDAGCSPLSGAALRTLLYFDIFNHPLQPQEIAAFCDMEQADGDEVRDALNELVSRSVISRSDGYYCTKGSASFIKRRRDANERAGRMMPKARVFARIIASTPFVRAVYISGSMSKGVMYPDSDIDFFIVTRPNMLWLSRTLLTFFRRVFLLNSHKYFCINYFVDEENLEIADRNRFTATEIAFLIPMWEAHDQFMLRNSWYREYYPNLDPDRRHRVRPFRVIRFLSELMLDHAFGRWLDRRFLMLSQWFWKRKFAWMDEETFRTNLRSDPGLSKHHPNRHQQFVMNIYLNRLAQFEQLLGCSLSAIDGKKEH